VGKIVVLYLKIVSILLTVYTRKKCAQTAWRTHIHILETPNNHCRGESSIMFTIMVIVLVKVPVTIGGRHETKSDFRFGEAIDGKASPLYKVTPVCRDNMLSSLPISCTVRFRKATRGKLSLTYGEALVTRLNSQRPPH
jgi:hypothetical protein